MDSKNTKLLLVGLGSFMLVLLQVKVFQDSIGFLNFVGITLVGDIFFYLSGLLSFVGVVVFVITAFKLIRYNVK
ncbi:hypothetical protein [Clostridium sp. LIBA-8841]|uniref:hypothetical protein n=1 Tax=Clostridium sp. LIBA-8841 TaxID=2987530 RepID=UPI002AC497D7|nr:hypothetical protein [Clostridium sp. LIBA-8841]MDZ5253580.1 hypothetical protein [Clostridium sp. LIBA-8841]